MAAEPARPEPVLLSGRGHNSERPAYCKKIKIKKIKGGLPDATETRGSKTHLRPEFGFRNAYSGCRHAWVQTFPGTLLITVKDNLSYGNNSISMKSGDWLNSAVVKNMGSGFKAGFCHFQ